MGERKKIYTIPIHWTETKDFVYAVIEPDNTYGEQHTLAGVTQFYKVELFRDFECPEGLRTEFESVENYPWPEEKSDVHGILFEDPQYGWMIARISCHGYSWTDIFRRYDKWCAFGEHAGWVSSDKIHDLRQITWDVRDGRCKYILQIHTPRVSRKKKTTKSGLGSVDKKAKVSPVGGTSMDMTLDLNDIIQVKMVEKVLGDGKLTTGKLIKLSMVFGPDGEVSDLVKMKLMEKLFSCKDGAKPKEEDMNIEQLMLFRQLQEGRFNPMELIQYKLLESELGGVLGE